tara:strand:+ start:2028 stop:2264 length:237 start_codon:yes stop_codon:yes gene_type:complete
MYLYRLVYILATKNGGGWEQLEYRYPQFDGSVSGEFKNRAAAKDFVDSHKDNWDEDVYILRKEVSHFYDQKIFDINKK